MSEGGELTAKHWHDTKIVAQRMLAKGKHAKARELLEMAHDLAPLHGPIRNQAMGMLFILDILHPRKR